VLSRTGFGGARFVAHSYSTFVALCTRQLYPEVKPDLIGLHFPLYVSIATW
jgi:hypothetical protein